MVEFVQILAYMWNIGTLEQEGKKSKKVSEGMRNEDQAHGVDQAKEKYSITVFMDTKKSEIRDTLLGANTEN